MAYELKGFSHTFPASTGLKQYQLVDVNSNGRVINPTTSGVVIGVLQSSGTTGSTGRAGSTDSGSVQTIGWGSVIKVIAGTTTIDTGDLLKADTDGRASTSSSTSFYFGRALASVNSTSTSAQIITALWAPGGYPA